MSGHSREDFCQAAENTEEDQLTVPIGTHARHSSSRRASKKKVRRGGAMAMWATRIDMPVQQYLGGHTNTF
jgi:hypothetical protein